jgi:hypothetical protein
VTSRRCCALFTLTRGTSSQLRCACARQHCTALRNNQLTHLAGIVGSPTWQDYPRLFGGAGRISGATLLRCSQCLYLSAAERTC